MEKIKYGKPGSVAKQIEMDFIRKGLRPGDRYFSATEAGVMLGVSQATADRAMRILANENKLIRKPRGGTFIGPSVEPSAHPVKVKAMYVFYAAGMEEALSFGVITKSIYDNFGEVGIQLISIPKDGGYEYFCGIIDEAVEKSTMLGAICVCGTRDMYEYLNSNNVPSVIFGTLHCDQNYFTSIDRDPEQSAELLVKYLVGRGRQKILVLIKNVGRAGSDKLIDAIYDKASAAGLAPSDIKVRVCSGNIEETVARMTELFMQDDRPNGIIVDGEYLIDLAEKVCGRMNLSVPQDVEIVFEGGAILNIKPKNFAHTQVKKDKKVFIDESMEKLKAFIEGDDLSQEHISLPVELIGPEE